MSKQMTAKDLEKLLGKKTSTSSEQMTVNDLQKMFTPSQPEQKSAATMLPFSNEARQKRVLEDFKPMTTNVFEREKIELPFNAPLSSEGLRSKLLEEQPINKADKAKGLDFSTFETTKKETEKESTGPDISNLSPGWQKAVKLARKGNEAIEKIKTTKGTANIIKPIINYAEGFSNVMEGLGDIIIGKPAGWLSTLGEKTDLEILTVIGDSFNKEFTSYDTSKTLRQTSKEMDPHVSKALKDGGFISGFSNLLGSLTVELPLYLAGEAGAEKLAGAFTKNTQAALVLGQVGSGAKKITTAQKLLNTKRIGGYASRFIASYGRTTSSFLNQGASYEDASKAGKIQGGVSVALNAMTSVLYGAHGDYLIKRLGDKVIVDAEQIVIETLSKQEMILGEVLNWLGVAGVEGLGYVARSYSQHELQKMILNPEMAGYFRNEDGEISLTNAGRDFLIGSVTSAIMQTPSRFKHFNEFKKYQDQLIAESSKAGIATGTKTKLEVSGKGTMEYDPKTGKLKVESTKGILEAQEGHVTKTESRSKVVDATGKDISSDFYKTPNTTRVTFIKELNASKEPNDIKINLIDREINNLNNLVTSGINLEKVNIEDWYDYKQELLSMKDSLLDSSTKEELTSALAGIKMSESSISDVPISPGVVEFKKELLTDKAKVAEKLDKDKKIKINSNKVKVEQEFEENIESAIEIIDTINKANPQSKPITILTEHSQDQQTAIDIGSAFGKQVVFVEGSELSGFTTEKNSNVVFIDTKASNALIKSPNSSSLYVLGHELFHSMKGSDSVIFNNFIKEVKKNLTTEQVLNFIELYNPESTLNTVNGLKIDGKINMNELLKNPDKYPDQTQVLDEVVEEIVANEFGGALVSPDFWRRTKSDGKLAELALKTLETINEPAYDSSLSQLQIDKVKNGFAEIVRSLDKPEEDIKKEMVPQTKKIVEKEPELKPELKETKPEPVMIKPKLPAKKEAVSKAKVAPGQMNMDFDKKPKLPAKEPVPETVKKIAEKVTGKKLSPTVKSNTIKRLSEQRGATTKRMELTKYYEGKDEIIVTDSYSLYSLKKGTEMPIEKGDSKFYDTTLKNLRERVTKNKEEETKVLDIQQIKDNKKNKSNIDKYNRTKSGVTFIDSITIDTDKLIDATRILGADLKYSVKDDGMPTLFLKNPDGETALILGIKTFGDDTKPKKDTKLPIKSPIKKATKEDIDHLFGKKQPELPQKTTKEELDLKLDMIKDNFKVFLDFKDRDILNTVIKDFNQYKKEGGTGSVPGLDVYMADKDKTITDWKDRLRASGFNIKELPKSKDEYPRTGEFKSRGIYKTILEKSPNEELADALVKRLDQQGVGKLNIEYERGSHEQYKKNVYDMLIADKSGTLDRFWNDPDDAPETIVLSKVLADYYISIGDRQSAVRAIQQVDGMGTLSGQIGEIHKIFTKDPTMFTLKIQKELGKFYEELRDSKDPIVKAWLNEHKGGIQFNDAEMELLYQLAKKQFELQEGTRERGIIESQIAKIIDEKKIKPLASKLKEFHRIALLSAPKTGTRNMFGNVPGYLLNTLSRNFIEVPLDKWMAKKDEMRTVGPLKPSVAHFKKGTKDAYTDFKLGINTNPTNVFERPSGKVFSEKHNTNSDIVNHMSDILGKTLNTSSRYISMVMDGGDRGFFEFYYDSDINFFTKVYADEDGNLPGEYKQIAKENAKDYTWKNAGGWMTQMLGGLRQGGNSILRLSNKGLRVGKRLPGETQEFGLGNILSVFIMTPGNLTAAMWHFSPFGALNAGKYFKDYTDAKKEGNYEDTFRNKRKFIKAVGKTAAGSAVWLASYLVLMAAEKNGKIEITGDYSDDVKVRELQKASGYKPFSIYIPSKNKYYGYAWIQPWGAPLGAMAEINRRKKTGESMDPGSLLKGMMGGMTEAMLDQSYLTALKYLIGGVTGKRNENPIDDFFDLGVDVSGMAIEQFYPNILKTIAGAIDNNLIDTYNPDRPVKGIGEQLIGYTPVKKKLPVKKDVFGGDRKFGYTSGSPFWDAINTIFNPMPISTAKYTSEYNELMDIYDKTGTSKFLPETITNKIKHKEQTIKMNPKQKQELQQRIGTMYYLGLKTLMDNKVYDTATASEKVRMLQSLKLYSKDVSIADMGLFDDYVLGTDAKRIQGYMDKGLSLESALVFYGKMDGNDKSYLKAKEVMKMNVSDAEKDIMLSLVSPTTKTSPTSSDLGHLDTDADFDAYYSLSSAKREQHSNYGKHFNIKVDTFASAIKDISKIESKKDATGKTIPNSKRDQVKAYIEKLPNLNAAQKLYLYNTVGYTINTKANSEIMHKYIESLSLSAKDKLEIWKALGFK